MPLYNLRPRPEHLEHRDWEASTHKCGCLVNARDVRAAVMAVKLETAMATRRVPGQTIAVSPWGNPDLVDIIEVAHIAGPMPREGLVTFVNTGSEQG